MSTESEYVPSWAECPEHPTGHTCYSSGCRTAEARHNHNETLRRTHSRNPEPERARSRRYSASGKRAAAVARRLERGELVRDVPQHHAAIRYLLEQRDGPAPAGYTASLLDPWAPSCYLGHTYRNGERVPYVLSTSVDDYALESNADNLRRGRPTADDALLEELAYRDAARAFDAFYARCAA